MGTGEDRSNCGDGALAARPTVAAGSAGARSAGRLVGNLGHVVGRHLLQGNVTNEFLGESPVRVVGASGAGRVGVAHPGQVGSESRAAGAGRSCLPGDGEEVLDGEAERLQFREATYGPAGWRWSLQYLQKGVDGGSRPYEDPAAIEGEAHDGGAAEAELVANACGKVDPLPLVDGDHVDGSGERGSPARVPSSPTEAAR